MTFIKNLKVAQQCLDKLINDSLLIEHSERIIDLLVKTFRSKNKVLICGNGGSACDAMHFAEEFTGRFKKSRRALPVIPLLDPSHLTCVANYFGFDYVFQRGVQAYAQKNDVFIGISTSGHSQNIFLALEEAKKLDCKTVLLLGKSGGMMAGKADIDIIVPGDSSDRIQELHMLLLHNIIECVEKDLFPELY